MRTQRSQDWVMLILGAWLFFSPFWMTSYASTHGAAAWNAYILGVLVVIFAVVALATEQRWEEWLELVFAIWMIISPYFLGFFNTERGAAWNQIIVGILVGIDAIGVLTVTRRPQIRA